jgi:tRNA-binding protein
LPAESGVKFQHFHCDTLQVAPCFVIKAFAHNKQTYRNIKMEDISWNDFEKVALHVGTVIEVEDFPEARKPAYIVRVDFGKDIGIKKSSAQITDLYDKKSLIGRQVVAVVNFPLKQIGPMRSECLITGFHRADGAVVLAVPDSDVPNGAKLA